MKKQQGISYGSNCEVLKNGDIEFTGKQKEKEARFFRRILARIEKSFGLNVALK